jgi:outer membrane protein assembly factor BamB
MAWLARCFPVADRLGTRNDGSAEMNRPVRGRRFLWSVSARAVCLAVLVIGAPLRCWAGTLLQEDFDELAETLQGALDEKTDPSVRGWAHTPPPGWSVDNSKMDTNAGITEWAGWSFTTRTFWVAAEDQGRDQFALADEVFAVADSDEYDDKEGTPPFDSMLVSPAITVPVGKTAHISWDTLCPVAPEATAQLIASINGGPDQVIEDYSVRNLPNVERRVDVKPPDTGQPWTLVIKWRYAGKNQWFWAIDNVRVADEPPPPPPPPFELGAPRDWPTYQRNNRRSGVTTKGLRLPLGEAWRHEPMHPPRPAWPEPAEQDVTNNYSGLSATNIYDRAFHAVVSGNCLFFASSADDSVYCLGTSTGKTRWVFTAGGPVRLAPTVAEGRVYLGSDDGCAYCLDAADGSLIWRHRAGPEDARLPGNERMISKWPVRSGVVLDYAPPERGEGGQGERLTAYFSAGLFPSQGVYLCAVDAANGRELWTKRVDVSPQGYMLASPERLFLPTGRTPPALFERTTGRSLGALEGLGGSFAIVLDDMVAHGPGERGKLHISAPAPAEHIVATPALRLVATESMTYLLKRNALTAFDRTRYLDLSRHIKTLEEVKERTDAQKVRLAELKKQRRACEKWGVPCSSRYALILADDTLFVGGDDTVVAYNAVDGAERWSGAVSGKAYGLAVGDGHLFVSTDTGVIHSFEHRRLPGGRKVSVLAPTPVQLADDGHGTPNRTLAETIVAESGFTKGYCLVLGAGSGSLVHEIVRQSDLRVIALDPNGPEVRDFRENLRQAGIYGTEAVVHHGPLTALPYQKYSANVVVIAGAPATPAVEVMRVLRPSGGTVFLYGMDRAAVEAWGAGVFSGWQWRDGIASARRAPLPGAGEWSHTYAEPGNTACSGDELVGAPLELQWFGRPGPRRMVDRHFRNVPPLCKAGRVFIPGNEIVYAADAYNGAALWQAEIPGSRRVGVFLGASSMVVDDTLLYVVAEEECRSFDVATGDPGPVRALPPGHAGEWGYVARADDLLLGTARPSATTYNRIEAEAELDTEPLWYPNMRLALSTSVFCLNAESGALAWEYRSGRIIDTTLTVGEGRLYFVETHSPKALADSTGRLAMLDIIDGGEQVLTAIDLATGERVFRRPIDMSKLQQPCYLSYAQGVLLLSGSRIEGGASVVSSGRASLDEMTGNEPIVYSFYAFDAATGEMRWQTEHEPGLETRGGHGEYNRHPTIVGDVAYMWPYAHNILTGERIAGWRFDRHGHGCGGVSASAHGLFWRGGNPWMYDLRPGGGPTAINTVSRPGCWLNIIPAAGLVLIPEASSGCTCGYPIQTSMAFAPRDSG